MPTIPSIASSSRRGFTLIELLIVVVIIGILAAIAIPKFANTKEKAIVGQMRSDLRNMVTAQEAYISDALTYYNGPVPSPSLAYDPSGNITVTLVRRVRQRLGGRRRRPDLVADLRDLHRHRTSASAVDGGGAGGLHVLRPRDPSIPAA